MRFGVASGSRSYPKAGSLTIVWMPALSSRAVGSGKVAVTAPAPSEARESATASISVRIAMPAADDARGAAGSWGSPAGPASDARPPRRRSARAIRAFASAHSGLDGQP